MSLCSGGHVPAAIGKAEQASQTLAAGQKPDEDYLLENWPLVNIGVEHDWLIAEILRREATESIAVPTEHPTLTRIRRRNTKNRVTVRGRVGSRVACAVQYHSI